nr:helix-turn-helix transcriptional regulator [uncultured Cohaesibacter sp.]
MSAQQFRAWRKEMGLKQKDAADLLGLKKRMIQYYEKGNRDGKAVTIPKSVRLACYALTIGISDFDGTTVGKFDPAKFKDKGDDQGEEQSVEQHALAEEETTPRPEQKAL